MQFPRASGILLHPTSLPSDFGIGDLGPEAFRFVDFLAETKQTYWQILPLAPTGWGDSPYSSFSAFAGNTLLISPERLVDDRLLSVPPAVAGGSHDRVDFGEAFELKSRMLYEAFEGFQNANTDIRDEFNTFAVENVTWLDGYSLYRAIKMSQGQKPWYEWDKRLKMRDAGALAEASETLRDQILAEKFYQFVFFRQWDSVKEYANSKGIRIVGDVPIFVALDSADVWRHQDQFKLNADGSPKVVSGVPPDYFSQTGQLWGNPIYDWDAMKADGFRWWTDRVQQALRLVDIVRMDHFRGFGAAWEVPGRDPTAEHGEWVDAPGRELFAALQSAIGDLPFWPEDLGFITPDIEALRDDFDLPGMRILQFAFGGDPRDQNLPHNYIRRCVAYTGTHDNDTTIGWWNSQSGEGSTRDSETVTREREFCVRYLDTDGSEIHWDFIRAIWLSVADTAIAPLQDVLGLGGEARMNLPASTGGNWDWRYKKSDLTDEIAERLRKVTETYGRASSPAS